VRRRYQDLVEIASETRGRIILVVVNLVFASGFLVPQRCLGQDYFRGVRAAFPGACFPQVPVLGSIKMRAQALATEITGFRFPEPQARIHIIAHSMGGLDARYALHRGLSGLTPRVASLSTIGTPHRGSPIADLLVGPDAGARPVRRVVYEALRGAVAAFGLPTGALDNLTTAYARRFNEAHPDIADIPCYCYAGNGATSYLLQLTSAYIRNAGQAEDERENDGLVSVASASWKPLAESPWPTDHLGEVGHSLTPPSFASSFPHLEALRRVIERAGTGA
jgi:triacylglycerol lipase